MSSLGHNQVAVRLGVLADNARAALSIVEQGEGNALHGWLTYGAALNEGRALFPSNEQFGSWVVDNGLSQVATKDISRDDRAAAMWASANPSELDEARAVGNARTVRGFHAQWKQLELERTAKAEREEAERKRKEAEHAAAEAAEKTDIEEAAKQAAEAAENDNSKAFWQRELEDAEAERIAAIEAAEAAEIEAQKQARKAKKAEKKAGKDKTNTKGASGTGENEWYTPQKFIEAARRVMGVIDVDPASSAFAQEKVQAVRFHSESDNGLDRDWMGKVWLNPPYSQPLISEFMEKLRVEFSEGRCIEAIALTHNYTDTAWFQETARKASAVCFTRGRVKFYSADGDIAAPTQGQAFFYFGQNPEAFTAHFKDIGFIVEVVDGEI